MTQYINDGQRQLDEHFLGRPGTTASSVAVEAETSEAQICHLRKGRRTPTLELAYGIFLVTGIPMDAWLLPAVPEN